MIHKKLTAVVILVCYTVEITAQSCDPESCRAPGGWCDDSKCWCNTGYYTRNCNTPHDTCANCQPGETCTKNALCSRCNPPCSEHGMCTTVDMEGPKCHCDEGWTGEDCSTSEDEPITPIKECNYRGCHAPNGWCNGTRCWCNKGYYSQSCKRYLKSCKKCEADAACSKRGECARCNPVCSEHGDCITVAKEGPRCFCREGWTGVDCTISEALIPGPCEPKACHSPNGWCLGTKCYCNRGYYSRSCKRYLDTCLYCENDAACTKQGVCSRCNPVCSEHGVCTTIDKEGPKCYCDEGWTGPDCSQSDTEEIPALPTCKPQGCHAPNGWCNGSKCWCNDGYYSQSCKRYLEVCANCEEGESCSKRGKCAPCNPPCTEHGECLTVAKEGARCFCEKGWSGPDCGHDDNLPPFPPMCKPKACHAPNGWCNETKCWCNKGYYSQSCKRYLEECNNCPENHACSKRGTCAPCEPQCDKKHGECLTVSKEGPKCFCETGWSGPDCSEGPKPIKPKPQLCYPKNCHGPNGWCDGPKCWCNSGFFHNNCKKYSETCANCAETESCTTKGECSPCEPTCTEHGQCMTVAKEGPRCYCDPGWNGLDCGNSAVVQQASLASILACLILFYKISE